MDMAPTPTSIPPSPSLPATPQLPTSRQPKPITPLPLSASQEAQVRALYYANVRARCAPEIQQFAACALNRTITVTWMCRTQRLAMNSCMVAHATVEEEDRAREEWLRGREERRRERERETEGVEERRREVIELIKRQEEKERVRDEQLRRTGKGEGGDGGGVGKEAKEKGGGFWGSVRR
jgi:COX assembly protein 1